jgi:spore coat polysaccharide biosynthesis predicted glycosyltransferase SpsG
MTLGNHFIGHKKDFLIFDTFEKGKNLLKESNFNYYEVNNLNKISEYIDDYDIIINDFLDTSLEYMNLMKDKFVINFEDLGEGSDRANIVYNALYEFSKPKSNHRFGSEYFILNDKILIKSPNKFNDEVKNVLITFGGIDQNNLTLKSLKVLERFQNIFVKIILGPGYSHYDELYGYLKQTKISHNVLSEVKDMGNEMQNIDLAITSNGRTVYELAAMNIPTISIAQNDRETMHLFSRYSKGIEYLGISCNIDDERLTKKINEIITNKEKRFSMYKYLSQTKIRQFVNNVKEDIINSFWRWKDDKDDNR